MTLAVFMLFGIPFWSMVAWSAVSIGLSYIISQLMMEKPKTTSVEPDELTGPTVRQGTKFTINFGTNWIENPVVAWWGHTDVRSIVRSYKVKKWFSSKRYYNTIGHRYYVGMELIITQGQNDGIIQLKVGDQVVWPDETDETIWAADGSTGCVILLWDLFGGEESGGGVAGTLDFEYGNSTQPVNDYLAAVLKADMSAGRGLTRAIFQRVYIGTSPYPKQWKFLVKRTDILTDGSTQWYPLKAVINTYDLNPAHIIHECYTNSEWGFGYDAATDLDATSWTEAADALYDEEFGLSMKWEDQNQTLTEFIKDVLRHINGIIFQDPETGKIRIKLIRNDYVDGDLETFDESDIVSIENYVVDAVYENSNFLLLKYWDRQNNTPIVLPEYNLALLLMQDSKIVPVEMSFTGIANSATARAVTARERHEMSSFPYKMTIKAKRTMSDVLPGDVFKLSWNPLGIELMYVRVIAVNHGTLQEGILTFQCMQDMFRIENAVFATPPATGWTPPTNYPAAAPYRMLMEVPYWDLVIDNGVEDVAALDADTGFVLVAASKPSGDALDYEVLLCDDPTYASGILNTFTTDGRGTYTPTATILSDIPLNAEDVTVDLISAESLDNVVVGSYAVLGNEILKVLSVDTSNEQVELARGCLDTVPTAHSGADTYTAGERIWFAGSDAYLSGREFTDGDLPGVKILPRTSLGQLSDGAVYNPPTFDSRMNRPYPPGDFKVNSVSYPSTFSGQPTISWAHRDRTQQVTTIIEHSDAGIGPETSVTYTLTIYGEHGDSSGWLRTETGLTGTSYTYSEANEMLDSGLGSGEALNSWLRFVLKAVRGGYDSWQEYDITVTRS